MGLSVCPAAVVEAPVEVIWANLVHWERYSEWFDRSLRPERIVPKGPASAGQTVYFGGRILGATLHFTFKIEEVDAERHEIGLHAYFPLRLQLKPKITCTPIDAISCRVQYG